MAIDVIAGVVVAVVALLTLTIVRTCKAFRTQALARINRKIDAILLTTETNNDER